jgi:hypothetical protein
LKPTSHRSFAAMDEVMQRERTLEDTLDRAKEAIRVQRLRFPRSFLYVAGAILAWAAFWEYAERFQHVPHAQRMVWAVLLVALWLVHVY